MSKIKSEHETKAMSLGDHIRRLNEQIDRLAEIARRIDEEMVRVDLRKPEPIGYPLKGTSTLSPRWPGAHLPGYGPHFSPSGQLLAGAHSGWHAAWVGEAETRFEGSPLLRPLVQQYAEQLGRIEVALNLGLAPVPSQPELPLSMPEGSECEGCGMVGGHSMSCMEPVVPAEATRNYPPPVFPPSPRAG